MDFVSTHNAREMYSRAGWTLAFTVVLYFINRAEYPGPAATLAMVLTLLSGVFAAIGYGLHWLATEGQRRVRQQLLDTLELQGSERILSLSHDLGLEAAERLKTGRVISLGDTAGNEAARETAKTAGLGEKIRFEAGDVEAKLSYPDANFDLLIGGGSVSAKAAPEMLRVLKPGARLVIHGTADLSSWQTALPSAEISTLSALPLGLAGSLLSTRK